MLDNEFLCELKRTVRRIILLKLFKCLVSERLSVNKKQAPLCLCKFKEAVNKCNSSECLSAPSCHLDKGAGTVFRKRFFKILDCLNLRRPETLFYQRRQFLKSFVESGRLVVNGKSLCGLQCLCRDIFGKQFQKCLRFME